MIDFNTRPEEDEESGDEEMDMEVDGDRKFAGKLDLFDNEDEEDRDTELVNEWNNSNTPGKAH
jgi:hypothetical protein